MKYLKDKMKIRYYRDLNGARWLGFGLAHVICFYFIISADIATQWVGWLFSVIGLYHVGVFWL